MRWQSQPCKDLSDKKQKPGAGKGVSAFDDVSISRKHFFFLLFLVVFSGVLHFVFSSLTYLNTGLMQGNKTLNSTKFGELTTMSAQDPESDFFFFSLNKNFGALPTKS